MLAGPRPRVFSFLSAESAEDKSAMLVNVAASLQQAGRDVVMLDARVGQEGIASRMNALKCASLQQIARGERGMDDAVQPMPQGFGVAVLSRGANKAAQVDPQRLDDAFDLLAGRADILVVDADLDRNDAFPIPALADSEIVIQVANSPASIKAAYTIIKRVHGQVGRRPFSILVTGATEKEAQVVYQNMAQVANRYLAVKLNSVGSVPADEHLTRAMKLGRAVVDAFPLAGASVAFRRLAGHFVLADAATAG